MGNMSFVVDVSLADLSPFPACLGCILSEKVLAQMQAEC